MKLSYLIYSFLFVFMFGFAPQLAAQIGDAPVVTGGGKPDMGELPRIAMTEEDCHELYGPKLVACHHTYMAKFLECGQRTLPTNEMIHCRTKAIKSLRSCSMTVRDRMDHCVENYAVPGKK